MAANVNITPGTGDVVAAEDITSVKYQKIKLVDATAASTAATGVAANPLQVSLANHAANSTAVKVDGSAVTQPISGSITNVSGTVSLPTGASTAANQTTANSSLSSIDGKITAVNTGAVVLAAGTAAFGKLSANSGVDIGDVDVTSVTPGTTATSLGKAEDAAHTSGDVGVMSLGVRNDAMSTLTSADGDYSPISVTSTGRLLVTPAPSSAMVRGNASVAGTGDTSLVAASGSGGLKTYITNLSFANTGSSNTLITVKDGSGGSTLFYTIAPAGGGSNIELDIPIVTTANTALYFACGTSSTTVYASATGYLAP